MFEMKPLARNATGDVTNYFEWLQMMKSI